MVWLQAAEVRTGAVCGLDMSPLDRHRWTPAFTAGARPHASFLEASSTSPSPRRGAWSASLILGGCRPRNKALRSLCFIPHYCPWQCPLLFQQHAPCCTAARRRRSAA